MRCNADIDCRITKANLAYFDAVEESQAPEVPLCFIEECLVDGITLVEQEFPANDELLSLDVQCVGNAVNQTEGGSRVERGVLNYLDGIDRPFVLCAGTWAQASKGEQCNNE